MGLQLGLEVHDLVRGQVFVAEPLDVVVVGVVGAAHHDAEGGVVLEGDVEVEVLGADGGRETRVHEVDERLCTVFSEELIEEVGPLGRCCAADLYALELQVVAVDERDDLLLQDAQEGVVLGDVPFVDGEDDAPGDVEELLVAEGPGVVRADEADEGVGLVVEGVGEEGAAGSLSGVGGGGGREGGGVVGGDEDVGVVGDEDVRGLGGEVVRGDGGEEVGGDGGEVVGGGEVVRGDGEARGGGTEGKGVQGRLSCEGCVGNHQEKDSSDADDMSLYVRHTVVNSFVPI